MFTKMKAAASAFAVAGVLALAGASAADATITVTGGGTFSGSAGASRLVVTGGPAPLNCTTSTGSGTILNGTYNAGDTVGSIVPAFSSCTGPLGLAFTVNCANTPSDTTMLYVTGTGANGTVPGEIRDIRCVVTFTLTGCQAVIQGSVPISYTNPAQAPPNGRLTVLVAGQSLNVTSTGCSSVIPLGAASFGAPSGGGTGLANLNYNLASPGPTIV